MDTTLKYGNETDDEIVKRHMHRELQTWISHLEAMINESDTLVAIVNTKIKDKIVRNLIIDNKEDTINVLNEFYTYRNAMNNIRECDELECDQFYLSQHDQVYERYVECVAKYGFIKAKVYQNLLD